MAINFIVSSMPQYICNCLNPKWKHEDYIKKDIGVDNTGGLFGEVSILECRKCGRKWLHYSVENEGFSQSGRWYRGYVSNRTAKKVTPENAVKILEGMDSYYYGGSYFKTDGRRGSGKLFVDL